MSFVVYLSDIAKAEMATIKRSGDNASIRKNSEIADRIAETSSHRDGSSGTLKTFCIS